MFDSIKQEEQAVVEDASLNTVKKIRKIMGVLPEGYKDLDFRQLYLLRDKYPKIYRQVERRLETGWETTISLMEQGMREGVIREVPIPIVKVMLEASLEQFFRRDVLLQNQISFQAALDAVVDILVNGISVREGGEKHYE